jgi:hypothetical protein
VEHARERRQLRAGAAGLCVLDRDTMNGAADLPGEEPGLAFFTWGRRHIESYLLVPAAIRRSLRLPQDDRRVERALQRALGEPIDEEALRDVDAKRLLARSGELARVLGQPLAPGRIARAMRVEEFHADVRALLAALRAAFGLGSGLPRVAVRPGRRGDPPVGGMLPSGG